ncbi:MAG: hypothetical protein JW750_03220 [Anaerolineaceae bacterium]|nr:hypothetical protein [Anaerolineaceae bacterium]
MAERKSTDWIQGTSERVSRWWKPARAAWKGAEGALGLLVFVFMLLAAYGLAGYAGWGRFLIGFALLSIAFSVISWILIGIDSLIHRMPVSYRHQLLIVLLLAALMIVMALSITLDILISLFAMVIMVSLLGASLRVLVRRPDSGQKLRPDHRALWSLVMALSLSGVIFGAYWLIRDGSPREMPVDVSAANAGTIPQITADNPALPGNYPVSTLNYGSGTDQRREEFGAEVDLVSGTVDGSKLVERWNKLRTRYWGFDAEALPLNGRVWYPDGEGPFPLVLIVHGNHMMEDVSDGGYAYLGELLASRGFIAVSVDENFLNFSPLLDPIMVGGLKEENDLRAWLLLEHLARWEDWNHQPQSPFYQRVDMDQIALIGHSRGGDAVAIAAAFNHLSYYPDDAAIEFDYHFNIRAVAGIAPVDGQYQPRERALPLENINYFVLHGAQDMDVFTFMGMKLYDRVSFTDGQDHFKSGVYIYGANHGQFNTSWGRNDLIEPVMRFYNTAQLMPKEDQEQIARVYLSAFLEAALHGKDEYRPLFKDDRAGRGWLPETIYLNQYEDTEMVVLCDFEEDIDPGTTTLEGGWIKGERLARWNEQPAKAKHEDFDNQAVYLGWERADEAQAPVYTVTVPRGTLNLSAESALVFSLADTMEAPRKEMEWDKAGQAPIDFSIVLTDTHGQTARVLLSAVSPLQPPIEGRLGKLGGLSPLPLSETIFQYYEFPMRLFTADHPGFDPANLLSIQFEFDQSPAGVIALDQIGTRAGN